MLARELCQGIPYSLYSLARRLPPPPTQPTPVTQTRWYRYLSNTTPTTGIVSSKDFLL